MIYKTNIDVLNSSLSNINTLKLQRWMQLQSRNLLKLRPFKLTPIREPLPYLNIQSAADAQNQAPPILALFQSITLRCESQ